MPEMQPGCWYYVIDCNGCGALFPIDRDHADGMGNEIRWAHTNVLVICSACGRQENRQAVEAHRRQAR
jgi:hypothetical protein